MSSQCDQLNGSAGREWLLAGGGVKPQPDTDEQDSIRRLAEIAMQADGMDGKYYLPSHRQRLPCSAGLLY